MSAYWQSRRWTIDWAEIHRLTFVDQPGCWQTCGSHCCKFPSDKIAFHFLPHRSADMFFFDEEFAFLQSTGQLQAGFAEKAKRWELPFADGHALRFVSSECALGGVCTLPACRPLICKLYPLVPRFDLQTSKVTGFLHGNVLDRLMTTAGLEPACTLTRTRAEETERQAVPALERLGGHPYFLLHFRAVELFLDAVAAGLRRLRAERPDLAADRFSRAWEQQCLRGRAWDTEAIRRELAESHRVLARRFPFFSDAARRYDRDF